MRNHKHYNWKGRNNVPENIKIHWIDPEKNLLPRRLLNNTNTRLNPNARNYLPKTIIARNPHFNSMMKHLKKRNTNKLNSYKKNKTYNINNKKGVIAINPHYRNMTKKNRN